MFMMLLKFSKKIEIWFGLKNDLKIMWWYGKLDIIIF